MPCNIKRWAGVHESALDLCWELRLDYGVDGCSYWGFLLLAFGMLKDYSNG